MRNAKFLLFSALLLIISSQTSIASQPGEFRMGVKMLPEWSKPKSTAAIDATRFTFGGGLQLYKNFNIPLVAIESGVYLTNRKGFSSGSAVDLGRVNVNQLSFPLLLRLHFWNIYASTGPSFDFALKKSATGGVAGGVDFKTFNLGYQANFGYEMTIAQILGIFAEARFNPTITEVEGSNKLKFTNFGLGVGVNFKLGGGGE